jgi:hypothetical protein
MGREGMFFYLIAVVAKLIGLGPYAMRLARRWLASQPFPRSICWRANAPTVRRPSGRRYCWP